MLWVKIFVEGTLIKDHLLVYIVLAWEGIIIVGVREGVELRRM